MKKINSLYLLFILVLSFNTSYVGQDIDSLQTNTLSFQISYWRPLIFGGFTKVREWENIGKKYYLNEDLGLNSIEGIDFIFSFPISQRHKMSILLGRYFFQGQQLLTENGFYNGTELQGNTVASVDASRYIRIMLLDYYTFNENKSDKLQLIFGISLDAIRFLVDAPFTEDTPRKETYEQFDKQIVPVPIIGLRWENQLNQETNFHIEVRGGTWPGIDTWYDEYGTIKIWQYNFETNIGVSKAFDDLITELSFDFRFISLKGESDEDKNEIEIHGVGPKFMIAYSF